MKKQITTIVLAVFIAGAIFTSCKKDKVEENEEEVITTMIVKLTPAGGGAVLEYKFDDPDGPGANAPTIQEIVLAPSKTYSAQIILLNKTKMPVDTISNEVADEKDSHRFYYEVQGGANVTVSNLDADANGVPVGLTSTWTTGAVSTGKMQITLRHYAAIPPNKAAVDLVNSSKSGTDISTVDIGGFTVKIQ